MGKKATTTAKQQQQQQQQSAQAAAAGAAAAAAPAEDTKTAVSVPQGYDAPPPEVRSLVDQYLNIPTRFHEVLQEKGRWQRKPPGGGSGEPREARRCFRNAHEEAVGSSAQMWVGYAANRALYFPCLHAWNTDTSGSVVETTAGWTSSDAWYFGVPVPLDLLKRFTVGAGREHHEFVDCWIRESLPGDKRLWLDHIGSKLPGENRTAAAASQGKAGDPVK